MFEGWAAAAATVVAGVGGAVLSGDASKSAANTEANAANNASQVQQNIFNQTVANEQPYINAGYGATSELTRLMGIGNSSPAGGTGGNANPLTGQPAPAGMAWSQNGSGQFVLQPSQGASGTGASNGVQGYDPSSGYAINPGGSISQLIAGGSAPSAGSATGGANGTDSTGLPAGYLTQTFGAQQYLENQDPGYGFQLNQGSNALQNSAAAGSGSLSGAALKSLVGYNQDYASTGFQNAYNRFNTTQGNIFQRLSSVAGQGQAAAANVGANGTATGGNIGANIVGAGNASAAGQVGVANAVSGGLSNIAGAYVAANGGNGSTYPGATSGAFGSNPSGTAAAGDYADWSDRRLKTDIERIGALPSGLALYRYRFHATPVVHIGVMADEALQMFPEAVVEDDSGYLKVDYRRIS